MHTRLIAVAVLAGTLFVAAPGAAHATGRRHITAHTSQTHVAPVARKPVK